MIFLMSFCVKAMVAANGLAYVPDSTGIEAGAEVDVYVIGDLLG